MSEKEKPTHTMPGGRQETNGKPDDGVVNDSFGTVNPADTTGTGEEEDQPCQKREKSVHNQPAHETGRPHR
ncbi:MAG TPA: hypothetical protein VGR47_22670 [Terracidiphilus sp.]|nr:hypothetical protein [Terracidiphilus sp.]